MRHKRPFQNIIGDAEQEYFADGLVDDIITALSRFSSLFVIARNSGFTMSIGPLGLLDNVAAIAKVAVASLDDVAAQAAKAGAKATAVGGG